MHEPKEKRKPSSEIYLYREECRSTINGHPDLHPCYKVILLRLVEYVNRRTREAFVGGERLAADCNTTTRSVRRALRAGKALGIIELTRRGNTGRPSRYVFKLPDTTDQTTGQQCPVVTPPTTGHLRSNYRTPVVLLQDSAVTRTFEITPEITLERGAASAAALESVVGVASPDDSSDNQISEQAEASEKRSGEGGEIPPTTSDSPTTEPAEMPKQTDAELCIEMAARGLDMSLSKLRRGQSPPEGYSAPPMLDERPITISQALIKQVQKSRAGDRNRPQGGWKEKLLSKRRAERR
jgi:hypothetical protein